MDTKTHVMTQDEKPSATFEEKAGLGEEMSIRRRTVPWAYKGLIRRIP